MEVKKEFEVEAGICLPHASSLILDHLASLLSPPFSGGNVLWMQTQEACLEVGASL